MTKRLLIHVDVDGPTAELLEEWLWLYNRDYNDHLTVNDIADWGLENFVKPECGIKIFDYLKLPYLYDFVKPCEGAREGIAWMRGRGHRVMFLTSGMSPGKFPWMIRQGFLSQNLFTAERDYIVCPDKGLVIGDLLIDDYAKNLERFNGHGILLTRPHNASHKPLVADGKLMLCAKDWEEIKDRVIQVETYMDEGHWR